MEISANRWTNTDKFISTIYDFGVGAKINNHMHSHRYEAWYILSGVFKVNYSFNSTTHEILLEEGESWENLPLKLHGIECIEAGTVLEVASHPNLNEKTIDLR